MNDMYKNKWLHYGMVCLIYGIGILTFLTLTFFHIFLHDHGKDIVYAYQKCEKTGGVHTITIHENHFSPDRLTVQRCDVVSFENMDKKLLYLPALGEHPHHIQYAGFTEKVLGYGEKNTFIAHTTGIFLFHDHLKDEAEGTLIVK